MSTVTFNKSKVVLTVHPMPQPLDLPQPKEWWLTGATKHIHAASPAAALTLMRSEPVNVVVYHHQQKDAPWTDFMRQLRERHPKTARITVGTPADRDSGASLLWLAHAFMPQQGARSAMKSTLARMFVIQEMLEDAGMSELLAQLEQLPSQGGVWNEIINLANRPNTSAITLARTIECDTAAAGKVLQLVNSSYFGLGKSVTSLHQAVCYVGLAQLRSLAVTAQLFSSFGDVYSRSSNAVGKLHRHMVLVGRLAKHLMDTPSLGDEAMAAGLLHDIGKLALLLGVPRQKRDIPESLVAADDIHGVRHTWLGAHMARLWGLPDEICDVVEFHHDPSRCSSAFGFGVLAAVHVADAIVTALDEQRAPQIDKDWLSQTTQGDKVDAWMSLGRRLMGVELKSVGT